MALTHNEYRAGRHVVFDLTAHIVLVTKYRKGAISDRVRDVLVSTIADTCSRFECKLLEADGESDHLHLLVSYPPKVSLSSLIMTMKANSSRVVRLQGFEEVEQALYGNHFWSPSYFVCSTGGAPLDRVAEYVRNQRKPNRGPGQPRANTTQQ